MKKYNLFLDDIRVPSAAFLYTKNPYYIMEEWDVVRSYDEFVALVKDKGLPEIVSFDHDLADAHYDPSTWTANFVYKEKTGMDCVKWMVEYCMDNQLKFPKWYVHSMNPIGGENMKSYINQFTRE